MALRLGSRDRGWKAAVLGASLVLSLAFASMLGLSRAAYAEGPESFEVVDSIGASSDGGSPAANVAESQAPDDGEPVEGSPEADALEADASQGEAHPAVEARISDDERRVVLTATGEDVEDASQVLFDVWSERGGRERLVRHGAVRLDDGTWTATIFIASATPDGPGVPYNCRIEGAVHRLLNPNTGQHIYTMDEGEADGLSRTGWNYEGVAWIDPGEVEGAKPVYRLYNPYTGDHLYTTDRNEYASLPGDGWRQESVAFHADPESAQTVYRLYNPYATVGAHHFTTSETERRSLIAAGWRPEGEPWCGAGANADGTWTLPSGNAPHDDAGIYHVEAVAIPAVGEGETEAAAAATPAELPIGEATFSVTAPSATAAIANVNEAAGTFDVVVSDAKSISGVSRVEVPVWTADDQHDIVWYPASPQSDGTYRTTVRATDHELGHDYQVHVYLRTGNGLHENVAQTSCRLELANFVHLSGGPNHYTLTIVNPGPASSVRMPTWSEANGQDDLVWYQAERQGDQWTAAIDTANLLDSGRVITHIYVDDDLRAPVSFDVSPKEVLTLRQRAIIKAAQEQPTLGGGYCAGWVSNVLRRAGQRYNMNDDANDMYYRLHLTNLDDILPGMVIAVSTHGHTWAGSIWGHVGIYLGDGIVIDDAYGSVRRMPLQTWATFYSDRVPVRFGFLEY